MSYSESPLPSRSEITIVGGGIIGACCAYYLARSGRQVCVLERDKVASGASGANAGLVGLVNKPAGIRAALIWESQKIYTGASAELDYDIEWQQPGGLFVFATEEARAKGEKLLAGHVAMGLPTRMLSAEEVRSIEPALAQPVLGALYSPLDGYLNPYRTTVAYARAARRLGVTFIGDCNVEGIEVTGSRVQAVVTSRGRLSTEVIVNAAGAWSAAVGTMVGLEVPVVPSRGQIMITERAPRVVKHLMYGLGSGVRHTADGGVIIGSAHEFVGFNSNLEVEALSSFARAITTSFPQLANLDVIRCWANFRPVTPDEIPIIGPAGPEGFILATGHFTTGVAMGPATGKVVAEMINGVPVGLPIQGCSFARFDRPAA